MIDCQPCAAGTPAGTQTAGSCQAVRLHSAGVQCKGTQPQQQVATSQHAGVSSGSWHYSCWHTGAAQAADTHYTIAAWSSSA